MPKPKTVDEATTLFLGKDANEARRKLVAEIVKVALEKKEVRQAMAQLAAWAQADDKVVEKYPDYEDKFARNGRVTILSKGVDVTSDIDIDALHALEAEHKQYSEVMKTLREAIKKHGIVIAGRKEVLEDDALFVIRSISKDSQTYSNVMKGRDSGKKSRDSGEPEAQLDMRHEGKEIVVTQVEMSDVGQFSPAGSKGAGNVPQVKKT